MQENLVDPTHCPVLVIGLVGDVAAGKSTVARRLVALGAAWIDADRLAHRCLNLPSTRRQLAQRFGPQVLAANGQIDRRALANRVFGDDAVSRAGLQYLEQLIHPLTLQLAVRRLQRYERRGRPAAVLDAPLLVEAGWDRICDELWCVRAPRRRREAWCAARGWSPDELAARERRQWPTAEKVRRSTVVLDNEGERSDLIAAVDRCWQPLIARCRTEGGSMKKLPPPNNAS